MQRGAPERINGLWCLISWRTINLPTVLSWLKVKCWNRSMRTAASEIAAAPSARRRILISSSSFSPAATLDEAVHDMAERAATSRQPWHTHTDTQLESPVNTQTGHTLLCIQMFSGELPSIGKQFTYTNRNTDVGGITHTEKCFLNTFIIPNVS